MHNGQGIKVDSIKLHNLLKTIIFFRPFKKFPCVYFKIWPSKDEGFSGKMQDNFILSVEVKQRVLTGR